MILHHKLLGTDIWKQEYFDIWYTVNDDSVNQDYANKLVPRAVGYSAAFLDYFFRGKIDIDDAIATYGADSSITELTFAMKNTTPSLDENQTVEPFGPGTIELVYSYIMPDGTRHYNNTGTFYTIFDSTDLINWEYVAETVTLPEIIPAGAYELSFTLVFRGKLGNEEGAVAAQNYKFDNSRIAYFNQPGGRPDTSNIYTVSPDGSNPYQVTNAETPNPWYFSPSWSKDGSQMAFEIERCSDPTPNANDPTCPMEYLSRNIAVIDPFSDQQYPNNLLFELSGSSLLAGPSFSPDGTKLVALMLSPNEFHYGNLVFINPQDDTITPINSYDDPNLIDLGGEVPEWSPDGDKIAYYVNRKYDTNIGSWIFEGDICYGPSFSPDGRTLAFSQGSSIYTVDRNGDPTTLMEIAQPGLLTGGLKWSPMLPSTSLRVQADPIQITAGEESVLSWESKRAVEVTVDGVPEKQPANGSVIVSPNTTTTYTLRAIGPTGAKETTVTVVVQ